RPKPERFHGRHVLNRYEDGMEKCIGCELCAGVCPARCIYVRGADNLPDEPVSPGERYGFVYEINYLRCIHCDLCVEACPTEAITESKLFEFSFTDRQDAIYTKAELVVALGLVLSSHPVHSALMLVMTLFGVAVLFIARQAHFLAAVQVIVYAGAIVVLFLFVIMLLGVDRSENLAREPLKGQRPIALLAGVAIVASIFVLARTA